MSFLCKTWIHIYTLKIRWPVCLKYILFSDHGHHYSIYWHCNPRSVSWILRLSYRAILFAANTADRNWYADLYHCVFRLLRSMAWKLLHGVDGKRYCVRVNFSIILEYFFFYLFRFSYRYRLDLQCDWLYISFMLLKFHFVILSSRI